MFFKLCPLFLLSWLFFHFSICSTWISVWYRVRGSAEMLVECAKFHLCKVNSSGDGMLKILYCVLEIC
jgi:hypothetical protein